MNSKKLTLNLIIGAVLMSLMIFASQTSASVNGKIAFANNGGISTMNPDGSDRTQLTNSGFFPAFSPDGSKIAFYRSQSAGIYLMNADGSNQTGKTDIAVYRDGTWYWLRSSDNGFRAAQFGMATDKPVVGDYDGDGRTDFAVFRQVATSGIWYVLRSSNKSFSAVNWGFNMDKPVPGDYDGDGKTDIAVFRPGNGFWYVSQSSNGNMSSQQFGLNGDVPAPSAFTPQ